MTRRILTAVAIGALALSLTACANGDTASETTGVAETATTARAADAADADLQFLDAVVRAKAAADGPEGSDMTAIFGTLENHAAKDVELTGFTTSLGDATYEIHEVVDGMMRQKDGGITIPAGGSVEFKPGAEHLMVLDYDPEIPAGDTVNLTLEFADGSTAEVDNISVRTMLPGDESYGHDGELHGHQPEMDHNMDHSGH